MGVLCGCIWTFTGIVRTSECCKPILEKFDWATAGAWGACAAMTFTQKDLYKSDKFLINMSLQLGIALAFAYQASTRNHSKSA